MPYKNTFTVPDYYPVFACKCGACRATCCRGWGITLSMDDYFRVSGVDCSPELRRRLDVAFRPATNPAPTPERYMMISHNWLGQCPLQTDDGYCALHRECGESAIPVICRRYPRCLRVKPARECCTSTSCERTLELVVESDAPLAFREVELEFSEDSFDDHPAAAIDPTVYQSVRREAFAILADRALVLDDRLDAIGSAIGAASTPHLTDAQAAALAEKLARTSDSLAELLADAPDAPRDLSSMPKIDIYMEKILANHIFYKGFPRSFADSSSEDEMAALSAVLALMRHIVGRYIAAHEWSLEAFIDCMAKLFRPIEHSRFDETAARFVNNL